MSRPSIYESLGASPAFARLAAAHHARCLADPLLNHPFSHPDGNPDHVQRLGDYWAEVFGGPPAYTGRGVDHTFVLNLHGASGAPPEMGERFRDCFIAALDDISAPDDPELRAAMGAYIRWAVDDVMAYADVAPPNQPRPVPHWSWDGLQAA